MAFEDLIEQKFIEFLKDYKLSFEKLKRPFETKEYEDFIKEKETLLKLYFRHLKEYILKLSIQTVVMNFELSYLMKSYENSTICDILTITEDFMLKYDICFVFHIMQGNNFYQKEPLDPKSTHFQTFYDFLSLYADASSLKWMDFFNKEDLFSMNKKPIFLTFQKEKPAFCSESNENDIILNLEEEFQNYSLKTSLFHRNSIGFQEFIHEVLKEKKPEIKLDFKLAEEIKLISQFFYFEEIKNKEEKPELKNKLMFFLLIIFRCNDIIKSSKKSCFFSILNSSFLLDRGINLKRLLKEKDLNPKITNNQSFLREFGLFANFKSKDEIFYLEYVTILGNYNYTDVFNEKDYRKTKDYDKIEDSLMKIIEGLDFSNFSDKSFNFYYVNSHIKFLNVHMIPFADFAEKSLYLTEQKVDFKELNITIQRYRSFLDKIMMKVFKEPQFLMDYSKFYYLVFANITINSKQAKEKAANIYELVRRFFELLVILAEKNHEFQSKDQIFALEKLIGILIDNLTFDQNGIKRLDFFETQIKEKTHEKLEDLILKSQSSFALILYNKFLHYYFSTENKMKEFSNGLSAERYLRLSETILLKMENIRYDNGQYLAQFLTIEAFAKNEDQIKRLETYFLTRYYLLKTNRNNYANFDERAVKMFNQDEVFNHLELISAETEKNLKIHLELAKKMILQAFKEKNMRKMAILNEFYQQINNILFNDTMTFFMGLKKDHGLDNYTDPFVNSMIKIIAGLYNPLNATILKSNPFAAQCSNLACQNISTSKGDPEKLNNIIVNLIDLASEKSSSLFHVNLDLKKEDARLLVEFYKKGFLNMDEHLITEENYEKCAEIKSLEFLLILIKKYNKRQRNMDQIRFKRLVDKHLTVFLLEINPFFQECLDLYLLDLIKENWSIEKDVSFIDYMSNPPSNYLEFAEVLCLKQNRLIKAMFLFIKSFSYYRDNNNMKPHGAKILNELISNDFKYIEIDENMINIEKLFEEKEKYQLFFLNLFKQKLFYKICSYYKLFGDAHPEPLILKNIESLKLISSIQKNIKFYLKIFTKLQAKCKAKEKNLNKYAEDISFILKTFYFKNLFVNFALNDLNLMPLKVIPFELDFLKNLVVDLQAFFKTNFEIFDNVKLSNEFDEFSNIFSKIKITPFFEVFSCFFL